MQIIHLIKTPQWLTITIEPQKEILWNSKWAMIAIVFVQYKWLLRCERNVGIAETKGRGLPEKRP